MTGVGFLDGFGFETLIAPCDCEEFLRKHWNQVPLLERRGLPDFYDGMPDLTAIDEMLAFSAPEPESARGEAADIGAALRRLEQGAQLVLQDAERQMPELALICRVVHADLGFRSSATVEISMASNRPHLDAVEFRHRFVLQLSGRREWKVPVIEPSGEFVLQAGDLLYLPPGCECQHRSAGEASVVVIISMKPMRWVDMTGDTALAAHDALTEDLVEELPPGWLHLGRDRLVEELSRRWRQAEDVMTVEDRVERTIASEVCGFPLDLQGPVDRDSASDSDRRGYGVRVAQRCLVGHRSRWRRRKAIGRFVGNRLVGGSRRHGAPLPDGETIFACRGFGADANGRGGGYFGTFGAESVDPQDPWVSEPDHNGIRSDRTNTIAAIPVTTGIWVKPGEVPAAAGMTGSSVRLDQTLGETRCKHTANEICARRASFGLGVARLQS